MRDDELEAVSGGVTSQSVDPAALAAQLMQSQLNAALGVATGGAHPVDTHTVTSVGTTGSLSIGGGTVGTLTPGGILQDSHTVQTISGSGEGTFTNMTPTVQAQDTNGPSGSQLNIAYNTKASW